MVHEKRSIRDFSLALLALVAALAALFVFTAFMAARIAAAHPPSGVFVDVSGGRLHLIDLKPAGPPRGTIVLLHGASGNSADLIGPLAPALVAAGFRVIAPDRPGHGWSDRPDGAGDASPARQADLIAEALGKMAAGPVIVLGHSLAGALAANFALDHANITAGLVLVSPVTHPWPGGIAWYYAPASSPLFGPFFTRLFTLPVGLLVMPAAIDEVFSPQSPPPDFIARTGVQLVLRPDEFQANAQDVAGLYDFVVAQSKRMKDIRIPTAIIAGDSDKVVYTSIHAVNSAREIPGATLEILPGVGHSPHQVMPEKVVATVLSVAARLVW